MPEAEVKNGYSSKLRNGRRGLDLVAGADHGDKAVRIVAKINLKSPQERRERAKAEYGCRLLSLGNIDCKKDTAEIMSLVKDDINAGCEEL